MSDDQDGRLVISATQLATTWDCERKWWLARVAKLPEPPKGYQAFGTVLHACLERWQSADEQGRVPVGVGGPLVGQKMGEPVEVFPPGWDTVEERGQRQTLTPNEAALVRRLVAQAVERGIVQRGDGRVLEREVWVNVIEGVDLVAYLDVFKPSQKHLDQPTPEIHDHKTFSESGARFKKQPQTHSPNYIGADAQLLTYAAATSIVDGWDGPVVVRHNQFPKYDDPAGVRSVEASVPAEVWAAHWARIQATAARLLKVREVKAWSDVPGPYGTDVCGKYGGCPFRGICGRVETLDGYRGRVERETSARSKGDRPNLSLTPRKGRGSEPVSTTTDIFARAKAARAQAQPAPQPNPAPTNPSQPKEAERAATPAASEPGINGGAPAPAAPAGPRPNTPPWGSPTCKACGGTGFSSRGRPCPICDALSKRARGPTSAQYVVMGDAKEGFVAVAHPDHSAELEAHGVLLEWSSKDAPQVVPASVPAPAPAAAPAAPAPKAEPVMAAALPGPFIAAPVAIANAIVRAVEQSPLIATALITPPDSPAPPAPAPTPEAKPAKAKAPKADKAAEGDAETRGRKPIGITILIGCAQLKGPDRPTLMAQSLLESVGAELAKDMAADSYWALDAFKRRERIRQRALPIVEALGRTVIIVPGTRDPDVDNLIGALLPLADVVIEGVR